MLCFYEIIVHLEYYLSMSLCYNVIVALQVKDLPPYIAVSSNTSGSTPKDLFEDVAEELDKQVSFLLSI